MPTSANSASCTTCEWGFFLRSPERISPFFFVTCSLRALHLSLLELANALLELVFPSTLFLSECRRIAVENRAGTNCATKYRQRHSIQS